MQATTSGRWGAGPPPCSCLRRAPRVEQENRGDGEASREWDTRKPSIDSSSASPSCQEQRMPGPGARLQGERERERLTGGSTGHSSSLLSTLFNAFPSFPFSSPQQLRRSLSPRALTAAAPISSETLSLKAIRLPRSFQLDATPFLAPTRKRVQPVVCIPTTATSETQYTLSHFNACSLDLSESFPSALSSLGQYLSLQPPLFSFLERLF